MAYRPHSERHRPLIGNAHTRKARDFVVYAGKQFIASAGMPTFGTPLPEDADLALRLCGRMAILDYAK